ncbi:MAG: hypothetical protein Q9184_007887, partial [Pyrenodesmia sp. 2 TL-2023]
SQQGDEFELALAALGIRHRDMAPRNMLWNQELQHLMFIDFERSIVVPSKVAPPPTKPNIPSPKRKALQELFPSNSKANQSLRTASRVDTPETPTMEKISWSPSKAKRLTISPTKREILSSEVELDPV